MSGVFHCSGSRVAALSVLILAALPARAAAEWQLAPLIGWTFNIDTTIVDLGVGTDETHWTFGGTGTLIGAGPFGVEVLFLYTPGFFGSDEGVVLSSRGLALMGNAVLTVPRSWNEYGLRPFVSGGLGLLHTSRKDAIDAFSLNQNMLAFNVGGGAVGFVTNRTGLRFDLRYFRHLKAIAGEGDSIGDVRLSYWTGTVGVVLRF